jgi:hypothetical protein
MPRDSHRVALCPAASAADFAKLITDDTEKWGKV